MTQCAKLTAMTLGLMLIAALPACNTTTQDGSRSEAGDATSTAPSGAEAKRADQALVRFINATTGAKDLYFGDLRAVASLAPQAASPYVEVPSERREFKLFPAGNNAGDPLTKNSESPSAGSHYTIVAETKTDGRAAFNIVTDELVKPAPGKAKIRVIHAASGVAKVDIYPATSTEPLISGLSFNDASSYKEVEPINTELGVRTNGSRRNETVVKNVRLMPDRLYTIVVMGGHGQPVTAQVIEDQLTNL